MLSMLVSYYFIIPAKVAKVSLTVNMGYFGLDRYGYLFHKQLLVRVCFTREFSNIVALL